jgi:hypothetical protein
MIPVETGPGMWESGEERIKESGRGGEFMHDIFDTL